MTHVATCNIISPPYFPRAYTLFSTRIHPRAYTHRLVLPSGGTDGSEPAPHGSRLLRPAPPPCSSPIPATSPAHDEPPTLPTKCLPYTIRTTRLPLSAAAAVPTATAAVPATAAAAAAGLPASLPQRVCPAYAAAALEGTNYRSCRGATYGPRNDPTLFADQEPYEFQPESEKEGA